MSDAVAHAALTLAKRNLVQQPLADPAEAVSGSGVSSGGGGGLHAHEEADAD